MPQDLPFKNFTSNCDATKHGETVRSPARRLMIHSLGFKLHLYEQVCGLLMPQPLHRIKDARARQVSFDERLLCGLSKELPLLEDDAEDFFVRLLDQRDFCLGETLLRLSEQVHLLQNVEVALQRDVRGFSFEHGDLKHLVERLDLFACERLRLTRRQQSHVASLPRPHCKRLTQLDLAEVVQI